MSTLTIGGKLLASVQSGSVSEELLATLAVQGDAISIGEKLVAAAEQQGAVGPAQSATLLQYLQKIVSSTQAPFQSTPILSFVLNQTTDSSFREVEAAAIGATKELLAHDNVVRDLIIEHHLHQVMPSPMLVSALVQFQRAKSKEFFQAIGEALGAAGDRARHARLLELLVTVVRKQGPNLNEIVETPALSSLFQLAEDNEDSGVVVVAALVIIMFLPFTLGSVSSVLPRVMSVLRRLLHWEWLGKPPQPVRGTTPVLTLSSKAPSKENLLSASSGSRSLSPERPPMPAPVALGPAASIAAVLNAPPAPNSPRSGGVTGAVDDSMRKVTLLFLQAVHAFFPNNLLSFFRSERNRDANCGAVIDKYLSVLRFSSAMVEFTSESEISAERWRLRDPAQLLAEALGDDFEKHIDRLWRTASDGSIDSRQRQRQELSDFLASSDDVQFLDPLQSGLAADKIVRIQGLLERQLVSFPDVKEADRGSGSFNAGKISPISVVATSASISSSMPTDVTELQQLVLILRNQLLFEKYMRRQHKSRLAAVQRNAMQAEQLLAEKQALESKLQALAQREEQLQQRWATQQERVTELREQNRRLHQNFTMQLNQLRETNKTTQEENWKLRNDFASQSVELRDFRTQVAQKDDAVIRLKAIVNDLTLKLKERDAVQHRLISMKEELVIWEEQHRQMQTMMADARDLRTHLQERDDTIQRILRQADDEHRQLSELNARLEESIDRMAQLKTENKDLKDRCNHMQDLLEYQKMVSQAKLVAVEDRCNTLKQIIAGLEKHILDSSPVHGSTAKSASRD